MYDGSGEFGVRVGVPAKSGVGGGIACGVKGRMGIGIYGPSLDEKGNSVAGLSALPHDLGSYALVIQCGGCVVTAKQLASRLAPAIEAGVPVSNYGLAIAYMNGIFERSMRIFERGNV